MVVAAAKVHDTKLLQQRLEAIMVGRPVPTAQPPQHLCLDKAYDNPAVAVHDYVPHIRRIGEVPPAADEHKYPPRRWVVERTLAGLSKCRAILVRYDKKSRNYLGLLQLACALLWYRRLAQSMSSTRFWDSF